MYKGYSYKYSTFPRSVQGKELLFIVLGDESLCIERSYAGRAMGCDSPLAAWSLDVGRHQFTTGERRACCSACMRQEELQPKIMRFSETDTS